MAGHEARGDVTRNSPTYAKVIYLSQMVNNAFPIDEDGGNPADKGIFYSFRKFVEEKKPSYFVFEDLMKNKRELAEMLQKEGYRLESAGPLESGRLAHWSQLHFMTFDISRKEGWDCKALFSLESPDSLRLMQLFPENIMAVDGRGKSNSELIELLRKQEEQIRNGGRA